MKFNRYFWKSGRNTRKRNAEERANLRRILLMAALMILFGCIAGLLVVLLLK